MQASGGSRGRGIDRRALIGGRRTRSRTGGRRTRSRAGRRGSRGIAKDAYAVEHVAGTVEGIERVVNRPASHEAGGHGGAKEGDSNLFHKHS